MDIKVHIGERIKELRDAKELSQQELANAADMERSFITHIESGKTNISVDTLQKVLEALEISFKDFFDSKVFTA
jgi:transcriptional regulator with XRE-family HTH domain